MPREYEHVRRRRTPNFTSRRVIRMKLKLVKSVLFLGLAFGTGCVRRTVTQDFGLTGITPLPRSKPQTVRSPDASLREVFKQQTQGAFNPLSDDRHIQELESRIKTTPQDTRGDRKSVV